MDFHTRNIDDIIFDSGNIAVRYKHTRLAIPCRRYGDIILLCDASTTARSEYFN